MSEKPRRRYIQRLCVHAMHVSSLPLGLASSQRWDAMLSSVWQSKMLPF